MSLTGRRSLRKLNTIKIKIQGLETNAQRNLFSYSLFPPICPRSQLCLWQLAGSHRGNGCMQPPHEALGTRQAWALLGMSSAQQEETASLAALKQTDPALCLLKTEGKIKLLSQWIGNKYPLALSQHLPEIWHAHRLQLRGTVTIVKNNSFKDFLWNIFEQQL